MKHVHGKSLSPCGFVSCTACLFGVAYVDTFGLCGVINAHVSLSASSTLQEKEQKKKEAPLLSLFSVCHFGLRHVLTVVMVSCWWSKCDVIGLSRTRTRIGIQSTTSH